MKMMIEDPSSIPVGSKLPFLVLQNQCSEAVRHEILRSLLRTPTQGVRVQLTLGWNTCLTINFDIENFGWKTCEVEKESIILVMLVGEGWCGWFYTPVCTSHALTVYLHSTFTVPPIGDTFGIQSNICTTSFFAEIVNVLRPLAIFVEELHRVSLTGCLTGL